MYCFLHVSTAQVLLIICVVFFFHATRWKPRCGIYFLQVTKYIAYGQLMNSTKKRVVTLILTFKSPMLLSACNYFNSSQISCAILQMSKSYLSNMHNYFKNVIHNNNLRYLLLVNVQVTKACNDEPGELGKARHCSCKDMKILIDVFWC